jgi:cytochrome c oxidase subunit 4
VSTTVEPGIEDVPVEAPAVEHEHPTSHERTYVIVAVVLAVLTAAEIAVGESSIDTSIKVPSLIVMMAVKFWLVVAFFMHLRYDAKLFGRMFWAGLVLAVVVYVVTLASFHFFVK